MWLGIRQRAERRRQECQKQNESPDAKKMRRCAGAQSCSSASFMEDDWRSVGSPACRLVPPDCPRSSYFLFDNQPATLLFGNVTIEKSSLRSKPPRRAARPAL